MNVGSPVLHMYQVAFLSIFLLVISRNLFVCYREKEIILREIPVKDEGQGQYNKNRYDVGIENKDIVAQPF